MKNVKEFFISIINHSDSMFKNIWLKRVFYIDNKFQLFYVKKYLTCIIIILKVIHMNNYDILTM